VPWVLQYWVRSNTHQHWFAIGLRFGAEEFQIPKHRKVLSLPAIERENYVIQETSILFSPKCDFFAMLYTNKASRIKMIKN
jgi:hypothetical protein